MRQRAILFAISGILSAQPVNLPSFDQYRVDTVYSGKPAPAVIRTAADRMFRTKIREGAKEGPNFGGHFTVAAWGCGAGCVQMALINAKDGRVLRVPFKVLGWEPLMFEGTIRSDGDRFEPLDFRKDSRLLIARGCPEEKDCGSYFFELAGQDWKLLRKFPAGKLSPK